MRRMPAEWEKQKAVLLSFPHKNSDWSDNLNSALSVFVKIAQAIAYKESVYIVCDDKQMIKDLFCSTNNMSFIELPTNDTWTRDYGVITVEDDGETKFLDFTFDGWGGKFDAHLDNDVNKALQQKGYFGTTPFESVDFVFEGGSIESDGEGTILTTSECLCNSNRNEGLTKETIEVKLTEYLGAKRFLWLDHGYLAGDDTDSHIDTLARFVNSNTIVYVKCDDKNDEHYEALKAMEKQLIEFTTVDNKPYNLVALPMTKAIYKDGIRLPATYANFLITNHALIYPTYDDEADKIVGDIFKELFSNLEIIPINCLRLIEQGGSLHCSTMQIGA
ncbi:Agmatine deiminase [Sulfurovum sp. enrichment culture clone C5]|uniref:Agmatine deiminase n=1 Tax=Sulfurovum sp. enrichment culture clone C5 TaxID=497650 RepID=A0A0S4XPU7_9BACT|nr:Agmatine deiminase [Sulfurovum sp. enrichment culture clone C5]